MNELTTQEMEQTSGGLLPLIGIALAVAGRATAGGPISYAIGTAGVGLSIYQAAEHYGGNGLGSMNAGVVVGAYSCYVP